MITPDKFWQKVQVRSAAECWPWTAGLRDGYGRVRVGRKLLDAHRYAWAITRGPILDGLCVLHRCDNRPCCNPAHLFLGSNADNVADRGRKGRSASVRGEANGNSRLTEALAREAIRLRAEGHTLQSIASRLGTTFQTIRDITTGRTWGWLGQATR
jgi:hypothetical protein